VRGRSRRGEAAAASLPSCGRPRPYQVPGIMKKMDGAMTIAAHTRRPMSPGRAVDD
jgi:hypothetical protein